MKNKIVFTDMTESVPKEYFPVPAKNFLPDWYKAMPPYYDKEKRALSEIGAFTNATAKKCLPLFDSLSAGYIIKTHCDISIDNKEINGNFLYQWPIADKLIELHDPRQYPNLPKTNGSTEVPKFISPWSVRTPRGYSSLFVSPLNRDDQPIRILSGIVDTDKYYAPVNLPFLVDESWLAGFVPAGTPIAQIIPFKRDAFKMEFGKNKYLEKNSEVDKKIGSVFFNGYKKFAWSKKDYS
jgi:hypothetical protein